MAPRAVSASSIPWNAGSAKPSITGLVSGDSLSQAAQAESRAASSVSGKAPVSSTTSTAWPAARTSATIRRS